MRKTTLIKIQSVLKELRNSECFIAVCFTIAYLSLEPLLTQVVAIRSYSIIYYPYITARYTSILVMLIAFFVIIVKEKTINNQGIILPVLVLFICYLLPLFIYGGNTKVYIETMVPLLAYYLIINVYQRIKTGFNLFISIVSSFYFVIVLVNLLFIVFPQLFGILGMTETESFISTIENLAGFPLVMGLFFNIADNYYNKRKVIPLLYVVLFFVSTYLMWTVAQLLGAIVFVLYLIPQIRKIFNKIDLSVWTVLSFALFIIFVWFWKPLMNVPFIKFLLEKVLKRDVTFTGRTYIWDGVKELISDSLILGHGLMENPQMLYFDPIWNGDYVHAHNIFLQTLYEGGIVTLIGVAFVLFYTSYKIKKESANNSFMGFVIIVILMFLVNLEMDQFFIYPWRSCLWCMICFLCNFAVLMGKNEY